MASERDTPRVLTRRGETRRHQCDHSARPRARRRADAAPTSTRHRATVARGGDRRREKRSNPSRAPSSSSPKSTNAVDSISRARIRETKPSKHSRAHSRIHPIVRARDDDARRAFDVMSLTSDAMNYLVYRYLLESGFAHSAFAFGHESRVDGGRAGNGTIPPGALISFVQKGLQYCELEANLNEVRFVCDVRAMCARRSMDGRRAREGRGASAKEGGGRGVDRGTGRGDCGTRETDECDGVCARARRTGRMWMPILAC